MAQKTFTVDPVAGTVDPTSLKVSILAKDAVVWAILGGEGLVMFPAEGATPVNFRQGPDTRPQEPAVASPIVVGVHRHEIRYWVPAQANPTKEGTVTAVLIIDP